MVAAKPSWRRLLWHLADLLFSFARLKAGTRSEAKIAMMAITTSSSIKVNADLPGRALRQLMFPIIESSACFGKRVNRMHGGPKSRLTRRRRHRILAGTNP